MTKETKNNKKADIFLFEGKGDDSKIAGSVYLYPKSNGMAFRIGDFYLSFAHNKDGSIGVRLNDRKMRGYKAKNKTDATDANPAGEEDA